MSFLRPDDHILIMDLDEWPLTRDELKSLSGVGIKTIYYHEAVQWSEMQPTPDSPINYDRIDRHVDEILSAGLKVLIPCLFRLPTWKPDAWYLTREKYGIPNYQSTLVRGELLEFFSKLIGRYDAENAQVIYSIPAAGEFPAHFDPVSSELPFPVKDLIDFLTVIQCLLASQHGEVWTAYHCYTNPVWWDQVYTALHDTFPKCNHYAIQFTYYVHRWQAIYDRINTTSERYGIGYFGGSEYVQGLRRHVPMCKEQRQRGLICAPIHPFQPHKRLETWMLDEIGWAVNELEESHA